MCPLDHFSVSLIDCSPLKCPLTHFTPTSHINEDKRKTEGQKQIFDVVYEVDGCPVSRTGIVSPEFVIS